jgi:choline dehydrogenase
MELEIDYVIIGAGAAVQSGQDLITDICQCASAVFHPISSCMMGPDRGNAVVDSNCRVYGVDNLRVVDASIFPTLTSGNTNAPTVMVAEKAADMILSRQVADYAIHAGPPGVPLFPAIKKV